MTKKQILFIGHRGKKGHITPVYELGYEPVLLISETEFKESYRDIFTECYIVANVFDWNEIKPIVEKLNLATCLTRFEDFIPVVACIGEYFSLPTISVENGIAFRNKFVMKQRFKLHHVPCADGVIPTSHQDIEAFAQKHPFPFIMKQSNGVHSQFVKKVYDVETAKDIFDTYSQKLSESTSSLHQGMINDPYTGDNTRNSIIIETLLTGTEISIDSFVTDEQIVHTPICTYTLSEDLGITDDHHLPFRTMPSALPEKIVKKIEEITERAVRALGAKNCTCHTECFVNLKTEEISVVEIAARGGGMRGEMTEETTGDNYNKTVITTALGKEIDKIFVPKSGITVAEIFAPEEGVLESYDLSPITDNPEVIYSQIKKVPGDSVGRASQGYGIIGKFMIKGENAEDSKEKALAIYNQVRDSLKIT